jgi:hypothetical protein
MVAVLDLDVGLVMAADTDLETLALVTAVDVDPAMAAVLDLDVDLVMVASLLDLDVGLEMVADMDLVMVVSLLDLDVVLEMAAVLDLDADLEDLDLVTVEIIEDRGLQVTDGLTITIDMEAEKVGILEGTIVTHDITILLTETFQEDITPIIPLEISLEQFPIETSIGTIG